MRFSVFSMFAINGPSVFSVASNTNFVFKFSKLNENCLRIKNIIMKIKTFQIEPCKTCGKTFTRGSNYRRHLKTHEQKVDLVFCGECSKGFVNKSNLKKHLKDAHKMEQMDGKCDTALVQNEGSNSFICLLFIFKKCVRIYAKYRIILMIYQFLQMIVLIYSISIYFTFSFKKGVKPLEKKTVGTQTDISLSVFHDMSSNQKQWKKNLLSRHERTRWEEKWCVIIWIRYLK